MKVGLPTIAALSTMMDVQIISAPWCKRCHAIKPVVESACAMAGASFAIVDYDDMEEGAEKTAITSLPTIRMRLTPDSGWTLSYTADTLEAFKTSIAYHALRMSAASTDF